MRDHCRTRLHQLTAEPARRITLEICAATLDDCLTAQAGRAQRVELNSALALGGLTPSAGVLHEVRARTRLNIIAMIRPRDGGFAYSNADLDTMLRDISILKKTGADGFAFGVLNEDRSIDVKACQRLIKAMKGSTVVFHRAFDLVPDPLQALETLIDLGVQRVLTSGQQATALEGAGLLKQLIDKAAGRIEILPGAGITEENAAQIISLTGATQLHASLSGVECDNTLTSPAGLAFRAAVLPEHQYKQTSADRLRKMRSALDGIPL